jgi:N-acyl-L-homoserine lactone synthetase
MIHIVSETNRHLYARQIWDMYVERRKSFVERNGWDDLMVFDGAEVDDFDDERAVYLMALDDGGQLQGAVRFRPTEDKSILFDKYAHLIAPDQPSLKGPETWEGTRVFTTDAFRRSREPGQRGFFGLALAGREVALDHRAKNAVGMMDIRLLERMTPAAPAEIRMLGLPAQYGYGVMVGTCVEVSAANNARTLESLAEPMRLSYEVTDEDVEAFGSLMAVQRTVESARWASADETSEQLKDRTRAVAHATALFAKHDSLAASELQGWDGN